MPLVTLQASMPHQTFATRRGDVTSDASSLIRVEAGTQQFADLLNSGCYVVPTAPSPPATDPLQTDPVE